ncbi:YbaB/EbfC family nucleoid-associated protein [Patescibacteria group bacterium]|nr:YbaB/EbfC family nucleoid-associated protein [Patescibacteria group bacterium]
MAIGDKLQQAKDLNNLRKQAQQIQKELKDTLIEVTEADGMVKVVFTGEQKIEEVSIDQSLLNPSKQKELQEAVKSAVSQAVAQSQKVAAEKMQSIAGGLGLPGM